METTEASTESDPITPTDWTNEDTASLIAHLRSDGEWPEPALLREIVARKGEAVPALISVVQDLGIEHPSAYKAVELLILIGDPSALPTIAEFFHKSDDDTAESLEMSLSTFGPAVIPYLLPLLGDRSLSWYKRAMASETLKKAARNDPALVGQLIQALHDALASYVADRDSLPRLPRPAQEEFVESVSSLISDLADLAAEGSRELIREAFDADLADEEIVGDDILDKPFFAHPISEPAPNQWMEWYESEYERRNAPPRPQWTPPPASPTKAKVKATPYIAPPKPGRNDPCWCGSGKKYKKCHLGQTDDRFA